MVCDSETLRFYKTKDEVAEKDEGARKVAIGYSNDLVVYQIEKNLGLTSEDAKVLFDDTKMFLWLCATEENEHLTPSKLVDRGWHEFILCMEAYREFCNTCLATLIYHRPHGRGESAESGTSAQSTYNLALATFGVLSENWNIKTSACSTDCRGPSHRDGGSGGCGAHCERPTCRDE